MGEKFGGIFILIFMLAALALSCSTATKVSQGTESTDLRDVEIREYQGEDLSSIYNFRENSITGIQHIDIDNYKLDITGLVSDPQSYQYDQVINDHENYKKVVTLNCVEGWSANVLWEGVLVKDLLNEAMPLPEAKVVIFHAYDGYTTSFPIEYLVNNDIIMAFNMNGYELIPDRGYPFALVAESKWGYKWIKWITEIELSDDVDYRGFWESAGYSNSGDLDESYFE